MNKKDTYDWPGEWFRATEDLGDSVAIAYGKLKEGNGQPEWFERPHYNYDGIGGLVHVLREQGNEVKQLPEIKGDKKTFFRTFRGMLAYLPTSGVRSQKWVKFDASAKMQDIPAEKRIFWHLFSKEETEKIRQAAKNKGISVNTYLLYHLDRVVSSQLIPASEGRRWMVPVNLRGAIKRPSELQVHNAFLTLDLNGGVTPEKLHKQINKLFARGFHWGAWFGFQSAAKMGKEGVRKFLVSRQEKGECWTGTFSNLGVWEVPEAGNWVFCTTAPLIYPIGAGCITMNGRMAISLQMHAAFGNDDKTRQDVLDAWKQEVLK